MGHHRTAHAGHNNDRGAARAAGRHDRGHRAQPAPTQATPHILSQSAQNQRCRQTSAHLL